MKSIFFGSLFYVVEDNEKPMAAFADNNGVEIGFSLYNSVCFASI